MVSALEFALAALADIRADHEAIDVLGIDALRMTARRPAAEGHSIAAHNDLAGVDTSEIGMKSTTPAALRQKPSTCARVRASRCLIMVHGANVG